MRIMVEVSDYDRDSLLVDAKSLHDISKVLYIDERFKVLPSVLEAIAENIEKTMRGEEK